VLNHGIHKKVKNRFLFAFHVLLWQVCINGHF
jgi:hypothetical protein